MGCFDSICIFTCTAIHHNNEVLLVALNTHHYLKDDLLETYKLFTQCDCYLKAKNCLDDGFKEYDSPFRFIGVGIYNNYGSIEGYNNNYAFTNPNDPLDMLLILVSDIDRLIMD